MSLAWMEKQGRITKCFGKTADLHKAGWVRAVVVVIYMETEESKQMGHSEHILSHVLYEMNHKP